MSEVDSLLDMTLDDLADLPSFAPFTPGAHRVSATMEKKEINKKPCIELTLKLIETLELADASVPEDEQSKPGDTANTLFFLDNDIGQGKFKAAASNFAEFAGDRNLGVIVEAVTDVECITTTSITIDKQDASKKYLNLHEIAVV